MSRDRDMLPIRFSVLALSLALAACSSSEFDDLQAYIAEVKARPASRIAPLPEFEAYETYSYTSAEQRDPFTPKEEAIVTPAGKGPANGLRPDSGRHREALEQFPLDALQFVGVLEKESESWAIIKAPDNLVYRAKVGNYIGQNHGKVVRLSETKVEVEEIIPDGLGGWITRAAALATTE